MIDRIVALAGEAGGIVQLAVVVVNQVDAGVAIIDVLD